MSKPVEHRVHLTLRPALALTALTALVGGAHPVHAEIVGGTPGLALSSPLGSTAAPPAAGPYHLRCWQEGKLIIDELGVQLSRDAAPDAELVKLRNAQQQPVLLVSRAGTTCLARPAGAALPAERLTKAQ